VFLRWIVRNVDRVLVSSQEYADSSLLAACGWDFANLEIHPFGVDIERFRPGADDSLRNALGLARSDVVLLYVGSLDAAHRFKGLDVLCQALASLRDLPWKLVIVGDGNDCTRLMRRIKNVGLRTRVMFVGDQEEGLLPRYYRLADVHVLPSTSRSEAFGLVTLEAAASGIPSVVSNLPGVRRNVLDGVTGALVPPGDRAALQNALASLIESHSMRRSFGAAARVHALQEYQWEPLIDRLERTYHSVAR
jgi:glycosyltransferase involved in cell wall biosynthesis